MALLRNTARKLRPGMQLGGKYSLVRRIAVGGMGEIWVAKNGMTDANVALKVLLPDDGSAADDAPDAEVRKAQRREAEPRFRHEAKLGAMLSHRNIVKIYDFLEEADGSLALVMELLRGETLLDYIGAKKTLDAVETIAIVLPLLSALEHAHETGVVHRDLKPANIVLDVDPDGHVTPKLLDFGIAKLPLAGVATLDGRVLGTPQYMSPEQIRSDQTIDGRSDLFTIGVLVFHMLTGISPFDAGSPSASLAAVLETPVDPDPRIDPRLWLVLQRALAKRAYERFATAGELAAALRQAVSCSDGELAATMRRSKPPPRSASVEQHVEPAPRRARKRRRGVLALGVVIAGVAAFGLASFARGRPTSPTSVASVASPTSPTSVASVTPVAVPEATTSPPLVASIPTAVTATAAPHPPRGGTAPKTPGKKAPVATHVDF
jgi:eukaryotic-like serine/threonine-protein kinase